MESILSLPLEKKIGQLFFIGLPGPEFDEPARSLIDEISPGGVCLFSRNIKAADETRNLLDSVRAASAVIPFLSIDQEGGLVDRLRRVCEPMPAASTLKTPDEARELASITAEMLRTLGFNMNFAPVVDVVDEKRSKFQNGLFSRAFGGTMREAAEFSVAYLKELQTGGIIGCLKHFPGLGATELDSHEDLPQVRLSYEELDEIDFSPYRTHFRNGDAGCVMIAHAAFPALGLQERTADGKLLPSSLSFNFVTRLLRKTMGFNGLAVTDDMEMGAIIKHFGIAEASRMAIAAGEDMIAICNSADRIREAYRAVCDAVSNGTIAEARIDESLQRIGALKNRIAPPLRFDSGRIDSLSGRIRSLKSRS